MELVFANNLCAAYVAEIALSFRRHHAGGFLGRTAIQKLAYFCQAVGVPIPCTFEIYNYGPYSDEVKFAVDSLLADDVLVDSSPNPTKYSNYEPINTPLDFPSEIKNTVSRYAGKIDDVVSSLGAYRPEQLELVATLHFVACKFRSLEGRKADATKVFSEFERIKGDKFPREDVQAWYSALDRNNLI